jgi:hypothetical protein
MFFFFMWSLVEMGLEPGASRIAAQRAVQRARTDQITLRRRHLVEVMPRVAVRPRIM